MNKRLLITLMLAFVFSITLTPAASQHQNPTFTVQTIAINGLPAYDMRVSPDGHTAAIFAGRSALSLLNIPVAEYTVEILLLPIRLIDLDTGNTIGQLTGQTDYASDVAFSPDGKLLASYHKKGEIIIWDIATQAPVQHLSSIMGSGQVAFLPDGKTLVVHILADGVISHFLFWDIATGSMTKIWHPAYQSYGDLAITMAPARFDYQFMAFDISPDGNRLATVTGTGEVSVWDMATFQQNMLKPKTEEMSGVLSIRSLVLSDDGKTLVYYDTDSEQTHIWDVDSQTEIAALPIGYVNFGLSPDASALAWATRYDVWYARVDQPDNTVKVMDFPDGLLAGMPTVAFSPDGSRIVVGGFMANDGANAIFVITLE